MFDVKGVFCLASYIAEFILYEPRVTVGSLMNSDQMHLDKSKKFEIILCLSILCCFLHSAAVSIFKEINFSCCKYFLPSLINDPNSSSFRTTEIKKLIYFKCFVNNAARDENFLFFLKKFFRRNCVCFDDLIRFENVGLKMKLSQL